MKICAFQFSRRLVFSISVLIKIRVPLSEQAPRCSISCFQKLHFAILRFAHISNILHTCNRPQVVFWLTFRDVESGSKSMGTVGAVYLCMGRSCSNGRLPIYDMQILARLLTPCSSCVIATSPIQQVYFNSICPHEL